MVDSNSKRRKQRKGKPQVASSTGILRGNMPEDLVKYQGKNNKNLQAFSIDGHTVIALKLPADEKREVDAAASLQGVGAGYVSQNRSGWECFVHHQNIGLKPLDVWKEQCAIGITQTSGVSTTAQTVYVSPVFPSDELAKCPSCRNPLHVLTDGTCSSCHAKIITTSSSP